MVILVSGGAGFVGREVIKQLLNDSKQVICFDDFTFGKDENIAEFKSNENFTLVRGNILNEDELISVYEKYKPECLIHLAAVHFIPFCNKYPKETMEINSTGTFNILNLAIKYGVKKVLFASTGAIYPSSESPLDESLDQPAPVDTYGISKLVGEEICTYFARKAPDVKFTSMRFFNVYGPFETNPHLIPEIITQLKENSSWVSLGNIDTKRDYIFTEDIARAVKMLALSEYKSESNYETFNIGTGVQYSGREILEVISKLLYKKIEVRTDPQRFRQSDKPFQIASINKIRKAIDWQPNYNIEGGLKTLLKFEKLL